MYIVYIDCSLLFLILFLLKVLVLLGFLNIGTEEGAKIIKTFS